MLALARATGAYAVGFGSHGLNYRSVFLLFAALVVGIFPEVIAAVSEMRRILKPSGHVPFVEHGLASTRSPKPMTFMYEGSARLS